MNKTVTINLSGIVFHIDEEAYQELGRYLAAIKSSFKNTEGGEEIIADIESRIAEIFKEKLTKNNIQVINMLDVKEVISIMGKPEEYTETENKQEPKEEQTQNATVENEIPYTDQKRMYRDKDHKVFGGVCAGLGAYFNMDPIVFRVLFGISLFVFGSGFLLYLFLWIAIPAALTEDDKKRMRGEFTTYSSRKTYTSSSDAGKRLFRDPDDKVLGGVCSGLGAYFKVDPIIFRLAFVVAFFGFGSGLLLYIVLLIVMPKAITTADKLRMKGEPINIDNIQKTLKEEFEDFKKKANDFSKEAKDLGKPENQHKVRTFIQDFFELFVQALGGFFRVAGKLIGVFLLIIGIGCFVALAAWLTGIGHRHFLVWGSSNHIYPLALRHYFLETNNFSILSIVGLCLVLAIPVLFILLAGVKLLFSIKTPTGKISAAFGLLWAIGIAICTYQGILLANDFSEKGKDSQLVMLQPISSDTLYLDIEKDTTENDEFYRVNGKDIFEFHDHSLGMSNVTLDVRKSDDSTVSLHVVRIANGSNKEEAKKRASNIIYKTQQKDSLLLFDRYFTLAENELWRNQEVNIILEIPVGKTVYLSSRMKRIIYDIQNVSDTYDSKMVQHYWTMKPEGLTCIDYNFADSKNNSQHEKTKGDDKNFDYKDFSELEVHGHFKVNVTKGDKYAISLNGDSDDLDDVTLELNGNELKIKEDSHFIEGILSDAITINITTPHLTRLELSGATTSNIEGFTEDEMKVDLSGANETNMDNMNVEDLSIEMSGASKLKLMGHGDNLSTDQSGATSFDGENYSVKEASIEMSGAGKGKVNATEKLDIDLSGACDLKYVGNPTINKDVSGLCSVKKL